jgi:hypothetical protein
MGFLVAKGFLRINKNIHPTPNKRLQIEDMIWAGKNVEPRILEVLPAAVLRLPKHFDLEQTPNKELPEIIAHLKRHQGDGPTFCGIPYRKLKVWTNFGLKDGRIKNFKDKRTTKTFRLSPITLQKLKDRAKKLGCTETEALEKALLKDS